MFYIADYLATMKADNMSVGALRELSIRKDGCWKHGLEWVQDIR